MKLGKMLSKLDPTMKGSLGSNLLKTFIPVAGNVAEKVGQANAAAIHAAAAKGEPTVVIPDKTGTPVVVNTATGEPQAGGIFDGLKKWYKEDAAKPWIIGTIVVVVGLLTWAIVATVKAAKKVSNKWR